jgi:hypothetical protein
VPLLIPFVCHADDTAMKLSLEIYWNEQEIFDRMDDEKNKWSTLSEKSVRNDPEICESFVDDSGGI